MTDLQTKVSSASQGIGTVSMLGVLFVGLKLTEEIEWSWWWVLAPFWVPWAVAGLLLGLLGILKIILWRHTAKRRAIVRRMRGQ